MAHTEKCHYDNPDTLYNSFKQSGGALCTPYLDDEHEIRRYVFYLITYAPPTFSSLASGATNRSYRIRPMIVATPMLLKISQSTRG